MGYFGGTARKAAEAPANRACKRSSPIRRPIRPRCGGSTGSQRRFLSGLREQLTAAPTGTPDVRFEGGFYDRTMGRCPHGHEHVIND